MKKKYSDNSASSQRMRVLQWLEKQPLTTRQARLELDCMSVAARIFELKEKGYHILTHDEHEETAFGDTRTIAKYVLVGRKEAKS